MDEVERHAYAKWASNLFSSRQMVYAAVATEDLTLVYRAAMELDDILATARMLGQAEEKFIVELFKFRYLLLLKTIQMPNVTEEIANLLAHYIPEFLAFFPREEFPGYHRLAEASLAKIAEFLPQELELEAVGEEGGLLPELEEEPVPEQHAILPEEEPVLEQQTILPEEVPVLEQQAILPQEPNLAHDANLFSYAFHPVGVVVVPAPPALNNHIMNQIMKWLQDGELTTAHLFSIAAEYVSGESGHEPHLASNAAEYVSGEVRT